MSKLMLSKFPKWDKTSNLKKANKACNDMYIKEYKGLNPFARDKIVALKISDNGRCWWLYAWLMENPFRVEH